MGYIITDVRKHKVCLFTALVVPAATKLATDWLKHCCAPPPPSSSSQGVRCFVHNLEQAIVSACASLGLEANTNQHTGVWVENRKVAAIGEALSTEFAFYSAASPLSFLTPLLSSTFSSQGLEVKRGITMHGFCLNCNPDLSFFNHIVPCGLPEMGVTSLSRELGKDGESLRGAGGSFVSGYATHKAPAILTLPPTLLIRQSTLTSVHRPSCLRWQSIWISRCRPSPRPSCLSASGRLHPSRGPRWRSGWLL